MTFDEWFDKQAGDGEISWLMTDVLTRRELHLLQKAAWEAGRQSMRRKPLRPVRPKKLKESREYREKAVRFLRVHSYCQCEVTCGSPEMCGAARHVHHIRGRGKYLLDERYWLAVCFECHEWIHAHPREAKERGWLMSRIANPPPE